MIYLDNNATTAPHPDVVQAVAETLESNWGNPSSSHALGRKARESLETARYVIASAIGVALPSCLVFTASGTEAINLAFASLLSTGIRQILVSATEHNAVLRAADRWADGRPVIRIPVDTKGALDLDFLRRESCRAPSVVFVALANNETGVIANIEAVASICKLNGALLHVDAVQAAGKISLLIDELECAAASISSHKFHGPPGCGVLYLNNRPDHSAFARFPAPGHQENGVRAGTENLPSISGCSVAANLIRQNLGLMPSVETLRNQLELLLLEKIKGSEVTGRNSPRLPNTINFFCPHRNAADMVATLSMLGVALSAGAACSNETAPSHVIRAMGFTEQRANNSLRLSLSCHTTEQEVEAAALLVEKAFNQTLPSMQ